MDTDVKELLLGEKRYDIIKAALESEVKFVPPTNKSIELDKPIEFKDGRTLHKILHYSLSTVPISEGAKFVSTKQLFLVISTDTVILQPTKNQRVTSVNYCSPFFLLST